MTSLAEKQRVRKVAERKSFLINELIKLDADIDMDKPLSEFNLAELEQIHINEKCRSENVFAAMHGTRELKKDAAR